MTDVAARSIARGTLAAGERRLRRRRAAEKRFRLYGLIAIFLAFGFLLLLLGSVVRGGYTAFVQPMIELEVDLKAETIDPAGTRDPRALLRADYQTLVKEALRDLFPEVMDRREKRKLYGLVTSDAGFQIADAVVDDPDLVGTRHSFWIPTGDLINSLVKGHISSEPGSESAETYASEIAWLKALEDRGQVRQRLNTNFLTSGDSREPEQAGIWGAVVGSFYTLIVTLLASFPVAVLAALYLEEFAPKNKWTDLIEVNINNLAAVPSVIFGLLGLAVFLNVFGMPRSAPLVGGLVLSLLTLPTIIIAARAALKAVPPSVREAALGIGASPLQVAFHHTLPLAMPGILTGTIIGMAGALGETAPLLMIGMVAFIVDVPGGFTDPSTVLPVQIYLWADSPERGFVEKTNAGIMILLSFLIVMNAVAIVLRKRFERRW
jgi:phosphate transport system permease protein